MHLSLWAGDPQCVCGRGASQAGALFGRVWLVPRRLNSPRGRVMVFYAPTVNSYKRFVDASWAPTRLAWSHDNRTAGLSRGGRGTEPENRMPHPGGRLQSVSDSGGGAGIGAGRDSDRGAEPPACFEGDAYAAKARWRGCRRRCGRRTERFAVEGICAGGVWERRGGTLQRTSSRTDKAECSGYGGDRLGAHPVLRKDLRRP